MILDNDLFDPDGEDPSLFNDDNTPVIDPNKDYVAELVGEGKKFKDHEALAKSVIYKDSHIAQIEAENAELRQQARQGLTLEEFYEKIKTQRQAPPADPSPNPHLDNQDGSREPELSVEQIDSLLDKKLEQKDQLNHARRSVDYVAKKAEEALGPGYQKVLASKVKELGISQDQATALAAQSPEAFLRLVLPVGNTPKSLPTNEVRSTIGGGSATKKTAAYFKEFAKRNPEYAKSDQFRIEKHNAAVSLGEEFFDI